MHPKETFNELAERVLRELKPAGRAKAIAAPMREIGEIRWGSNMSLTLADCAIGFRILSEPKKDDEPGNVKERRVTCGEIAKLAGSPEGGNPLHLAKVFRATASWFRGWSEDPRQIAMMSTATREAIEIETT